MKTSGHFRRGTIHIRTIQSFHAFHKPVNQQQVSTIKCIENKSHVSKHLIRKAKGEGARQKYRKSITTTSAGNDCTRTRIVTMCRQKIKDLAGMPDEQARVVFHLMSVTKQTTLDTDDLIRTTHLCYPERLPTNTTRRLLLESIGLDPETCTFCGSLQVKDELTNRYSCTHCGTQSAEDSHIIGNLRNSINDAAVPGYSLVLKHQYDRMNNFKNILNDLRGLGETKIAGGCVDKLRALCPNKVTTPAQIMKALKEIKMGKYIPMRYRLAAMISDYKPIVLELDVLTAMKRTFATVCNVFDRLKNKGVAVFQRKNFMSYQYVLYQLLRECGARGGRTYIKLPSGKGCQRDHDIMWKHVCTECKWVFLPLFSQ
jgi:hypothetical protein